MHGVEMANDASKTPKHNHQIYQVNQIRKNYDEKKGKNGYNGTVTFITMISYPKLLDFEVRRRAKTAANLQRSERQGTNLRST